MYYAYVVLHGGTCCVSVQAAQLACSDMDSEWKALENAAAEMLADCETEDWQTVTDHLSPLRTKLTEVKETVERKEAARELLAEHSEVRTATEQRIAAVKERLEDVTLTVDEMEEVRCDLDKSRSQLMELGRHHPEIEAVIDEAGIVVKDRKSDEVVHVRADVEQLLSSVEKEDKKLKVYEEIVDISKHIDEAQIELNESNEVYTDDLHPLASSIQVLT